MRKFVAALLGRLTPTLGVICGLPGPKLPMNSEARKRSKSSARIRADQIKGYRCKNLIAVIEDPKDIRNIGTVIRNVNFMGNFGPGRPQMTPNVVVQRPGRAAANLRMQV